MIHFLYIKISLIFTSSFLQAYKVQGVTAVSMTYKPLEILVLLSDGTYQVIVAQIEVYEENEREYLLRSFTMFKN